MARSPAYARIKRDVLALTCAVPPGRVTTYGAIGDALSVMARHVAYILATLTDQERADVPWHRVVGEGGAISRTNPERARAQSDALAAEGLTVADGGIGPGAFARAFVAPETLGER